LSGDVQRLNQAVTALTEHKLPAVSRRVEQVFQGFENEQVYRRGCEYLFGTNGYVGLTYEVSAKLGFSLIKQAADRGNVDAQYVCGRAYFLDHGCGISYPDAVKYFRLAAEQGHSYGQVRLGICQYGGSGVERNTVLARQLFAQSAGAGNAFGQCWQGIAETTGAEAKAACYRLSAEQGNCAGQRCLADCLENGKGVGKNFTEAARYYRLAADQGHGLAQAEHARTLEAGTGVTRDYLHARHYYLRAANDRWTGDRGVQAARQGYERCLRALKGGG
jgi:TPR repeat protein